MGDPEMERMMRSAAFRATEHKYDVTHPAMDENLTPPMREALARLARNMVWADGRSVQALIRRGLVERRGSGTDAMIGAWHCDVLTAQGRETAARLGIEIKKLGANQ